MMTIAAAAVLTVFVIVIVLAPLMIGDKKQQRQGWLLLSFITLSVMGIYLWRGAPDIPSQPALLQKEGPAHDKRMLVKKELELMEKLAANPDNAQTMLSLGAVRLQNGRIDEAIVVLTMAHEKKPEIMTQISLKLGAAHYAAALSAVLLDENPAKAQGHFEKALGIAPKDAPYRERLLEDMKAVRSEK